MFAVDMRGGAVGQLAGFISRRSSVRVRHPLLNIRRHPPLPERNIFNQSPLASAWWPRLGTFLFTRI